MASQSETKGTGSPEENPAPPTPSPGPREGPEASDWETRFRYLLADFDNFRRRTDRDRASVRAEAEATLLRRLIPLVEGFQQAESAGKSLPPADPLRRGLELLGHELELVLKSVAFEPVARVGEPFRPEEHEAVGETVGGQNLAEGDVAEIVQQGYRFQGGLLRPAKVLVARSSPEVKTAAGPPNDTGPQGSALSPEEEGSG